MASATLIIGEDDWEVASAAKRLAGGGEGLEVFDSAQASNAEAQLRDLALVDESFSTPPFLDPVKTTWWKNVGFLPQSGKGAPAKDVKEALERFAAKIASTPDTPSQKLIISGPRLLMGSIFAKTLKSAAEFIVFAVRKPWEAARSAVERVREAAAAMNLAFERGAAEAFVAKVGTDARSLESELGKMRDYLGPGAHAITAADVAAVSSQGAGVEPELWAVTDAMGERNVAKALEALAPFERENGFAVLAASAAERFFRQLLEMKDASAKGMEIEGMNPYAAKKNAAFLRNWTLLELRSARARFLSLRERAVTSSGSVDPLVIAEIVRTCRRRKGAVS